MSGDVKLARSAVAPMDAVGLLRAWICVQKVPSFGPTGQ